MKRGLIAFLAIVIAGSWAFSLAAFFLQDSLGPLAGLILIPSMLLPFIAAFVGNHLTGGVGNMFKGLRFGGAGWIFLAWIGGIALAYCAALVVVAFGLNGVDFSLSSGADHMAQMAQAQGAPSPADQGDGIVKFQVFTQLLGGPVLGVWFMAAFITLVTFPWLGWFARRMMVYGMPLTIGVMMGAGVLHSCLAGLIDNPQLGDLGMAQRLVLMGLQGSVYIPLMLWLLLKTRSAVVPAMAQASVNVGLTSAYMLLSGSNQFFGFPAGIIPQLVVLAAGIGLWVWQNPGGKDLAVAGVAYDGTLLTPEMLAAQGKGEPVPAAQPEPAPVVQPEPLPPAEKED